VYWQRLNAQFLFILFDKSLLNILMRKNLLSVQINSVPLPLVSANSLLVMKSGFCTTLKEKKIVDPDQSRNPIFTHKSFAMQR